MALRSVPVGPLTRGARRLRAYLERCDLSVPAFCEAHHLDRFEVQRLIRGETKRVSVDLAAAVEVATRDGAGVPAVIWRDWLSATLPKLGRTTVTCNTAHGRSGPKSAAKAGARAAESTISTTKSGAAR